MNLRRLLLILIVLLFVIALVLWLLLGRQGSPPIVGLQNASGQKVWIFHPLDTAAVRAEHLHPATHYDVQILQTDGSPVVQARLLTDARGVLAHTALLYDIGVKYEPGSRVGRYVGIAEQTRYTLVLSALKQRLEIPFDLAPLTKPIVFSANHNGDPLNGFIRRNQDVYAVGKNFPAGATIRLYVVEDQYTWSDGDALVDVSGGYQTVNIGPGQTEFLVKVWSKENTRIGSYDIIADALPMDGLCSMGNTDPNDCGSNVGFCVQDGAGTGHITQCMTCQTPDPPLPSAPNPDYKDHFNEGEEVWVAVNPYTQGQNYAGMNARIYVVEHKTEAQWTHGTILQDLSGGYEETVIQPGCANVNYTLVWTQALSSGGTEYDVVVDFEPFGIYDLGTDIVDMLDLPGLCVGATSVSTQRIKFNWGAGSGAVNLKDHITNAAVPVPEFDLPASRNEPAAYVEGSAITVQVQFHKNAPSTPDQIIAWATSSKGPGLSEQSVDFGGSNDSPYISFTGSQNLKNYIKKNSIVWQWYYKVSATAQPQIMNATSHIVCTTWATPLDDPCYKKPMLWTSDWARYRTNEKAICDAIITKLPQSGLKYGIGGWSVDNILDNGGGMCGGWYEMFAHMAACQGVLAHQRCYLLQNDAAPSPEIKWTSIVIKAGGLNQTQPTHAVRTWHDVDAVYPSPANADITDRSEKRYKFNSPDDGHCINFLEYQGALYLYDASFGTGPFANTFSSLPSGSVSGTVLTNFRSNYHDIAIDYMYGNIKKNDNTHQYLTIKSTLIPDLRDLSDPNSFEIHYNWY